tara:strand:- start:61 stop:300 length:240 start_codon:yes stop_codon:yes gene_type:complete
MNCKDFYQKHNCPCKEKECRYWMDYEEDLNCSLITVDKHKELTLREIAERLHISFVRVQQIQVQALKKLTKRIKLRNFL